MSSLCSLECLYVHLNFLYLTRSISWSHSPEFSLQFSINLAVSWEFPFSLKMLFRCVFLLVAYGWQLMMFYTSKSPSFPYYAGIAGVGSRLLAINSC